jgi:hypothetical protein
MVLEEGIKAGATVTIRGVAAEATKMTATQVLVGRAVVQVPRYSVSVATTDWSWTGVGEEG